MKSLSNSTLTRLLEATTKSSDPLNTVQLGVGFKSFDGSVMAQAVDVTEALVNTQAESSFSDCLIVENVQSLRRVLGLEIEGGFSFGAFSAKASVEFLEESQIDSYDFFVLAYMTVKLPTKFINGGDLTAQAKEDARQMSQDEFYAKYGDSFVRSVNRGGNLYGLLHVSCQNRSQRSWLRQQFGGSFLTASAEVRYQTAYQLMSRVGQVRTVFKKTGGLAEFVDQENFLEQLRGFSAEVRSSGGTPTSVEFASYDLTNWEEDFQPKANFKETRRFFVQAYSLAEKCSDLIRDCRRVLQTPDSFDLSGVTLADVNSSRTYAQSIFDRALAKIDEISESPFTAEPLDPIDLTIIRMPPLKAIEVPSVWTWVGVTGISVVNGNSDSFAGIQGHPMDSLGVRTADGRLDVHFFYRSKQKWVPHPLLGLRDTEFAGGDGGKCGPDFGRAYMYGVSIAIGGSDAHLFDVCYEFRFADNRVVQGTNGNWLLSEEFPTGLRVFLQAR